MIICISTIHNFIPKTKFKGGQVALSILNLFHVSPKPETWFADETTLEKLNCHSLIYVDKTLLSGVCELKFKFATFRLEYLHY